MQSSTVVSIFLGALALTHGHQLDSRDNNSNPVYASALQLGYNPAQASYYASAITQGAVASAFNELGSAGVLAEVAPQTGDPARYNSLLDAGIASLQPEIAAAATSFFAKINHLNGASDSTGITFLTAPATATATGASVIGPGAFSTIGGGAAAGAGNGSGQTATVPAGGAAAGGAGSPPSISLVTASAPPSITSMEAAASVAMATGVSMNVITSTGGMSAAAAASSVVSAARAPRQTGFALGAVIAGAAGLAIGL